VPGPPDRVESLGVKLPRYTLRTLFILIVLISIPMSWVAYQLNWKRQRINFLRQYHIRALFYSVAKAPWPLRLVHEPAVDCLVNVPKGHEDEAHLLFPEALINPTPSEWERAFTKSLP
jgi:hypothetical protein